MKVKDHLLLQRVGENAMAVPVGNRTKEVQGVIGLNQTGACLWEALTRETSEESLIDTLVERYTVSVEQARKDVRRFLLFLREQRCLDE